MTQELGSNLIVSGDSPILKALLQRSLEAAPWLRCDGARLIFGWEEAVQTYAKEAEATVDPRVAKTLNDLLPTLPLFLFAVNAPTPNYFNGDERTAGITLSVHPVEKELQELLTAWATEVDKFRAVIDRENDLAAEQEAEHTANEHTYNHPYKDGVVQKALGLAASVASMTEFRQTLNVRFDLTNRLSVASADMGHFLAEAQAYPYNRAVGRQAEIRHELRHLCGLRLDLLEQISSGALDETLHAATLASLARREQTLAKLLHSGARNLNADKSGLGLITWRPGYAIAMASGTALPFDLSPYATPGSMLRSYSEDFSDIPLPTQAQMLAAAVRYAIPDAYRLTTRHVTHEGSTAGRVFVAVTERLQAQLRRIEKSESESEAAVDATTFAAARHVDQILQWGFTRAPLLTLLLSNVLATYRQGDSFGFALSPWVVANALSDRVLKTLPLTFVDTDASKEPPVQGEKAYLEPAPQAQTTGLGVWDKFLAMRP